MSGLLGRLVSQSMPSSNGKSPARIRAAMSVHKQAPLAHLREERKSKFEPHFLGDMPGGKASGSHTVNLQPSVEKRAMPVSSSADEKHKGAPPLIADSATRIETHTIMRVAPQAHKNREHLPRTETPKSPEPLFDEVPTIEAPTAITPSAAPPSYTALAPAHARTEPTEVHVHIGRIEVIAAPEPVAHGKQRSAPRNTQALSDYLAGGRRP